MRKRLGAMCVLLILTTSVGHSQEKETVSARQILDRMLSVYASCKSYVDKGQAKVVVFRGRANRVETKSFTTAFVRPSQFRFEFTEHSDPLRQRLVVWRDQTSIRSWWALNRETKYYETLGEPLRNATGVSSTSSAVVPTMLFQNLGDERRLQTLTELSLVGEEKVRGSAAYRVQGKDWANIWITVWVDKKTFLLLKLFDKRKSKNGDFEITVQYEPQIDVDVPPEKLAFKH